MEGSLNNTADKSFNISAWASTNEIKYTKLYEIVHQSYVNEIKIELSDVTTQYIKEYKKALNKSVKRYSGDIDPLLLLPLNKLYKLLGLDEKRKTIIEELTFQMPTDPNLIKARREIRDRGLIPHVFKTAKLNEVLDAITNKGLIEEMNIAENIKDPLFRFITKDQPLQSSKTSEALFVIYKEAKTVMPLVQKMGIEKLKENADDFATQMYQVVKKIQEDEKVSSYRETVKALNDKHVPSYRGGEWHVNTLQQLQKRWKDLGLVATPKPK